MFKRFSLGALLVLVLVLVCSIGTASAVTFEVSPFVGIRTTGEFDDIVVPTISEIEIDSGTSFGLNFGIEFADNWQVELLYSTQTSVHRLYWCETL